MIIITKKIFQSRALIFRKMFFPKSLFSLYFLKILASINRIGCCEFVYESELDNTLLQSSENLFIWLHLNTEMLLKNGFETYLYENQIECYRFCFENVAPELLFFILRESVNESKKPVIISIKTPYTRPLTEDQTIKVFDLSNIGRYSFSVDVNTEIENLKQIFTITWPNAVFNSRKLEFTSLFNSTSDQISTFYEGLLSLIPRRTNSNSNFFLEYRNSSQSERSIINKALSKAPSVIKQWFLSQIDLFQLFSTEYGHKIVKTMLLDCFCFNYILDFLMINFLESVVNKQMFKTLYHILSFLLDEFVTTDQISYSLNYMGRIISNYFLSIAHLQNGFQIIRICEYSGVRFRINSLTELFTLTHSKTGRLVLEIILQNNSEFLKSEILQNFDSFFDHPFGNEIVFGLIANDRDFFIKISYLVIKNLSLYACNTKKYSFINTFFNNHFLIANENNGEILNIIIYMTSMFIQLQENIILNPNSSTFLQFFFNCLVFDQVFIFSALFPHMEIYLSDLNGVNAIALLLFKLEELKINPLQSYSLKQSIDMVLRNFVLFFSDILCHACFDQRIYSIHFPIIHTSTHCIYLLIQTISSMIFELSRNKFGSELIIRMLQTLKNDIKHSKSEENKKESIYWASVLTHSYNIARFGFNIPENEHTERTYFTLQLITNYLKNL